MVAFNNIVFIVSFLMLLVASKPEKKAQQITLLLEQSTRLNCSTDPVHPVDWYHNPVGAVGPNLFYTLSNIYGFYGSRGRHKIAEGTYDLLISNATEEESGVYICRNAILGTDIDSYDVLVLKSLPHCTSNRSLNDLLVDNDCALTPDYVQLNCSVAYRGNFPPNLRWHHSAQPDMSVSRFTSQHQVNSVSTSLLQLNPEFNMNGTYFICSVEDFYSISQIGACLTENITIAYIFSPTTTISEDNNVVTCIANTSSQQCAYRWYGTHMPTNVSIESLSQTMQLDESLNKLRCETKCRIRGDECIVKSSVFSSSTLEKKMSSREGHSALWVIISVILMAVVFGLMTVYAIRKCKKRRSRLQNITDGGELFSLLLGKETSLKDFDRSTVPKLQEYIDAVNGLTDNLFSKGLLTDNECFRLAEISSYGDRARDLLNLLNPRMEKESERRLFLAALIETDQKHIYNYLIQCEDTCDRILNNQELLCMQRNFQCFLELINSTDYFLDQLVRDRCITKQQGDRIKQHKSVKKERRNRELLAIMRRRSFAHFEAFKRALKKTKQDKVFQILDKLNTSVVSIHCVSSIDASVDDVPGVESNVCESLNNPQQLSEEEQRDITTQLHPLSDKGVEFVGASPNGSIVVYFMCESFDAVIFFKKTYDSGELKRILESVFNCIAARSAIHLTVEVNLEESIYEQSISEARKTMYYNDIEKKTIYPDIMSLPAEVSKMILKKALILSWSAGFRKTSNAKAQFTKSMGEEGKSAYINLKSVSYGWMGMCELKSLFRQGCFPKQQLLDGGQTAKNRDESESNIRNQQTEESQTHNINTSQEIIQEKSLLDATAPEAVAVASNTSENLPTIDECNSNVAEFLKKIYTFKQHHNKLTTKCYQLKIHHTMDYDFEGVIRKFYELETKPAMERIKLIEDQWRTLELWETVHLVNPRSKIEFDRDEIIKHDETLVEYRTDETLNRSIVLCCRFEDVMKELGWKVGDTLDIEEEICDVVGTLMMKVAEPDRYSILNCMQNAITNILAHEREVKCDKLRTLLTARKKYNGLNLACILLEQMILDNKDNSASWMRIVCTQFIDLVVQLIIEPAYREDIHLILNHLMKLESLWSVADIYIVLRKGIVIFQYRQDYFVRYLRMIRRFAVDPLMNVGLINHKAGVCLKSILYCRDGATFAPLNSETYDVGFEKSLDQVLNELDVVEIAQEEKKVLRIIIENSRAIVENTERYEPGIKQELHRIQNSEEKFDVDMLSSCLAVTSMALFTSKKYWPSNPQLVSYCLLLARNTADKGRLLEIWTGEGKSCVIAMVAATYALLGRTVDIVTSSPVLSQRDAEEWRTFYTKLNLSAACNVEEIKEKDTGCYECPIVYGTVETFARDILKTEFLLQDLRRGRSCDLVIVDEVDSMLIDQGVQCTYLSHDVASSGMSNFEPILALIWMHVSRLITIQGKEGIVYYGTEPELFLDTLSRLSNDSDPMQILRLISNNHPIFRNRFAYLSKDIDEQRRVLRTLRSRDILNIFVSAVDHLRLDISIITDFHTPEQTSILVLDGGLSSLVFSDNMMKEHLRKMMIDALSDGNNSKIVIPAYLRKYCMNRLGHWINNAFVAKQMKYGREYTLENNVIYPVDYKSTGVIELNKKWGDGLQQFLELKHGLPLSPLSLITNFLSNIDYFKRYGSNILGVSGTLGNNAEKIFMNDTFSVEFATIPTSKRKKVFELDGKILEGDSKWQDAVSKQVESTIANERAVLIICEDITTAKHVHECIASRKTNIKMYVYTKNSSDDEDNVKNALKPRDVVITTNLGARGSDFLTDDIVNKNGGLFVLVTFIPMNDRVEKQAFGRTGRRGATGSCQILVNRKNMPVWLRECETVDEAKRLRDSIEKHRLQRTDELDMMRNKCALFLEYCELKKRFVTLSECDSDDLKIQVEFLDETWAKWIQDYEARIHESNKGALVQDLRQTIEDCSKQAKRFDSDNIYHLMKFGAVRLMRGDFEGATTFYDQVICKDPAWSAFAHYNRAYCTIQMKDDGYIKHAIDDLKATLCKLEIRKNKLLFSESVNVKYKSWEANVRNDSTYEKNNRLTKSYIMMECQLLHHIDEQIIETIENLEEIKTKNEEVKTERWKILDLIPSVGYITDRHLEEYRQLELFFTFSLDEKPKWCYEAKIVSSLVMLEAVSNILLRLEFQGISLNADPQFESYYISELMSNLGTVNNDSLAWMSRCFVATVTTGIRSIEFMRDVSYLIPLKQPKIGSTSNTNPKTSEFSQFSLNRARHWLTLLIATTKDIKKLICLTENELILHITNVVMSVLVDKIEGIFHEKLKPGQKLHRELCALYGSVKSQSTPNFQQFVDCIQDQTQALAYSSQLADDDCKTIDLTNNIAVELVSRSLNGSITSTNMSSVITEITATAAEIDIITAVSKISDVLAVNMNTFIMNIPEVGYISDDGSMLDATNKILTSVCSDIVCSVVQSGITQALMFDLRERTLRSYSLIYDELSHATMERYPIDVPTSKSNYSKVVSEMLLGDLLIRLQTLTNGRIVSECNNCNVIILDVDEDVVVTFKSPEPNRTIQLVYNPPCCVFPGGHFDAYVDERVVQLTRKKIYVNENEDDEEDDNLWWSAIATAKDWGSFISVKRSIRDHIIKQLPRRFAELLASVQYACQLKRGRSLLRLNMNHQPTLIDQPEHEQLDSSHLLSCIEQASKSENVSPLARVLAQYESELKSAEESNVTTSLVSRGACGIFLSSGRSVETDLFRQLVFERIVGGDMTTALQLCCISHQMLFIGNTIDAISLTSDPQILEDFIEQMSKRTLHTQERTTFLSVCNEWYKVLEPQGLMNVEQKKLLRKWIIERQYANIEDSVVSLMIEKCSKKEQKRKKEQAVHRERILREEEAKKRIKKIRNKELIYCRQNNNFLRNGRILHFPDDQFQEIRKRRCNRGKETLNSKEKRKEKERIKKIKIQRRSNSESSMHQSTSSRENIARHVMTATVLMIDSD